MRFTINAHHRERQNTKATRDMARRNERSGLILASCGDGERDLHKEGESEWRKDRIVVSANCRGNEQTGQDILPTLLLAFLGERLGRMSFSLSCLVVFLIDRDCSYFKHHY